MTTYEKMTFQIELCSRNMFRFKAEPNLFKFWTNAYEYLKKKLMSLTIEQLSSPAELSVYKTTDKTVCTKVTNLKELVKEL